MFRPFAPGHRGKDIRRRRYPDSGRHLHRRFPAVRRIVQHEAAFELHRPPAQHRLAGADGIGVPEIELIEDLAEIHVHRPVDDQAQRPVLRVFADIRDCLLKIRILHRRHGDEQVSAQSAGAVHA